MNSPHASYFAGLQKALKDAGVAWPVIVVDRERMRRNAARLKALIRPGNRLRLVEKSLPVPAMLEQLMGETETSALMVFHEPQLRQTARRFPGADLLLGKPLPVAAAAHFYEHLGATAFDPARQLQWLIDTPQRLQQYLALARALGIRLRINVEIDVGLHRGGCADPAALIELLTQLRAAPEHAAFAGLMGYDAFVGKLPALIESEAASFARADRAYGAFQQATRAVYPELPADLCWNGAGSPTVALHHRRHSVLNEVSAGSCLLKGTMFDLPLLADFEPAVFIASPILKSFEGTRLAGPAWLSGLLFGGRTRRQRSYFTYGGDWRADIVSPPQAIENKYFGVSYNQAMFSGPDRTALAVDDFLFLRPHQSEGTLLQMGALQVVENSRVIDTWLPFTE
jgi:D-serine deaminase-like pyridoxal phosphate-dependent protein